VMLINSAISTSGDTAQFIEVNGKRYSHLVDPRTGVGMGPGRSVSVIAMRGELADAMSSAICMAGREQVQQIAASMNEPVAVITASADANGRGGIVVHADLYGIEPRWIGQRVPIRIWRHDSPQSGSGILPESAISLLPARAGVMGCNQEVQHTPPLLAQRNLRPQPRPSLPCEITPRSRQPLQRPRISPKTKRRPRAPHPRHHQLPKRLQPATLNAYATNTSTSTSRRLRFKVVCVRTEIRPAQANADS